MTKVFNLSTQRETLYSCGPRDAVIAAYAQSRGDWSTWLYEREYSHLVETGKRTVTCGDYTAINR